MDDDDEDDEKVLFFDLNSSWDLDGVDMLLLCLSTAEFILMCS